MKVIAAVALLAAVARPAYCETVEDEGRIERLEVQLEEMSREIRDLKEDVSSAPRHSGLPEALSIGGYGEIHAQGNTDRDHADIHRFVLYLGYDFAKWIRFNSEIEIEHAEVEKNSGGYVVLEQAHFDFKISKPVNIRAGRVLMPLGIINQKHEPTQFYGVERPSFYSVVIPSTWFSDGAGVFGSLGDLFSYEAYVVGGLDGSRFKPLTGIRDGRIKERPSLNEPAVTGRMDFRPFARKDLPYDQNLRLGLSGYTGGIDNGNKGINPGIDGRVDIYSADAEYSIWKFDFSTAAALVKIDGAGDIGGGVASEIMGWYATAGYHFWPEAWKTGRLSDSDAVVFVRHDRYNTQHKMPSGVAADPAGDRRDWTVGMSFYPVRNVVVKADYQFRSDASDKDPGNVASLGIGWEF